MDIRAKDKSMKITWIFKLPGDMFLSKMAYKSINPQIGELIWQCNLHSSDVSQAMSTNSCFWRDVLKAWAQINFMEEVPNPQDQVVWLNSHIKINRKIVWWPEVQKAGLNYVNQLFDQKTLIPAQEANTRFSLTTMQFNSLITALPSEWKRIIRFHPPKPQEQNLYQKLQGSGKIAAEAYQLLIKKDNLLSAKHDKWQIDLNITIPYDDFVKEFRKA